MLWKDKEIFLSFPNLEKKEFNRVFLMTDKFTGSGSLRYTFSQQDADNGRCRNIFKDLDQIEILEESNDEGMAMAHLIDDKKAVICRLQTKERIVLQWVRDSFKAT